MLGWREQPASHSIRLTDLTMCDTHARQKEEYQ